MSTNHKKNIHKIMEEIPCEHNFACYYSPNGDICKAQDIGIDGFLNCQDDHTDFCLHRLDFGYSKFCSCPMNNYIIKNGIKQMKCKSFFCRLMEFTEKI